MLYLKTAYAYFIQGSRYRRNRNASNLSYDTVLQQLADRDRSLFTGGGCGDFEGALIFGKSPMGGHLFLARNFF